MLSKIREYFEIVIAVGCLIFIVVALTLAARIPADETDLPDPGEVIETNDGEWVGFAHESKASFVLRKAAIVGFYMPRDGTRRNEILLGGRTFYTDMDLNMFRDAMDLEPEAEEDDE